MAVRKNCGWGLTLGTVLFGAAIAGVVAPLAVKAEQAAPAPEVTFTKDIAPILQRSCQNCHRPGQVAPMSLLTYEDARQWARTMKQRTGLREGRLLRANSRTIGRISGLPGQHKKGSETQRS